MNDQAKLSKMLEMILLLAGNAGYSKKQIADKFQISERTVYRYLETFRQAGLVLDLQNGYYRIDRNNSEFKDISQLLHFSKEEGYILSKAIHAIDDNHVIKSNLVKKLYALYDFDRVAQTIVKKEHSENVHLLMQAIKNKKQVKLIGYRSANSNKINDRIIEPFGFSTNYIDVWGYEPSTNENKLFKTARIEKVNVLTNDWQNASKHDSGFIDVFRISSQQQIKVKLELTLRAMSLLIEEYPLAEQYISPKGNEHYLFDGVVCNFEGVSRFIMGLCNEVKIIEPNDLKVFIRNKTAQCSFL